MDLGDPQNFALPALLKMYVKMGCSVGAAACYDLSLTVLMCLFGCRLNKSNRAISTICTNLFIDKGKSDQYKS